MVDIKEEYLEDFLPRDRIEKSIEVPGIILLSSGTLIKFLPLHNYRRYIYLEIEDICMYMHRVSYSSVPNM